MPTSLIQQQHEIIRRSQSTINEYEKAKADAEERLKHEKEAVETAWKQANTEADAVMEPIRQSMQAVQKALDGKKWNTNIGGGVPKPFTANATDTNFTSRMTQLQSRAKLASDQIIFFLQTYSSPSAFYGTWGTIIGGLVLLIGFILWLIVISSGSLGTISLAFTIFLLAIGLPVVWAAFQLSKLRTNYATLIQTLSITEDLFKRQLSAPKLTYDQEISACQARYTELIKQLDQKLARNLNALQVSSTSLVREAGIQSLRWDDPTWSQWQPSQTTYSNARLGTLTTGLHKDLPAIPAFVACPGSENLLFEAAGVGKNRAIAAIQSLMLRLLATQPPGKVRFTLIDPVGLGQNVSTFMQLSDHHEGLVGSKAWSESRHIDQQLADLSEHMGNVIQKYLRGQYKTIEEYNQRAGEVAEPYRILVVMGFPVKFSQEAAGRLVEIATNGPKCGVSTLVMMDTEQPLPYGFNLPDLELVSTVIAWEGQRFVWRDKDFESCQLQLDTPPSLDLFNRILQNVGGSARAASEVQVPFNRIALPQEQWWTGNTREGIKIPLGRVGATKLQLLDLGKGTSQHVLVVGKTGSGKTTLLHVLIANLALTYSPDELELYLVDFKTVGFTPYTTYRLPHARVVATQSEREFGLSVLQGLDAELERRKNTFSKTGVQDIAQYRSTQPNARMPRILLLVDEFQEFFTEEDKVAQQAGLLLDRLVRQGRAFGIHVMLGSQTLAGTYTLARSTIGQMAVRVALQCEEADSRLVLSDDNPAARLLSRPGEAIYNAANGLVEGNNPFQCCWLPDDELDVYLGRIQQFAQQRRFVPLWRQIVFDGSKNADVVENSLLNDALRAPTWVTAQKSVRAWLGDPIAIKEPTAVQIRAQAGNNLLIVGQQEEVALGMLVTALLSLTTQHAPGTALFYIVDFSSVDVSYAGLLERVAQMLPHGIKVVNRRGLLSVVTDIGDEVEDRMEKEDGRKPPIYLFIYGLQRARDLRPDEDFSFSSFGSETPAAPSPAKRFSTILREGPELDVHTLAWCDTLTNLNRTLERGTLREFEMRAVFQMSSEDSMNLVDSPAASKLGSYRALLFSEETGRAEKFRPYDLPSEEWLRQAVTFIRQKR